MSHYYTNDDNLEHREIRFSYTFRAKEMEFLSDLGVFSKNRVDFATNILLNSLDEYSNERVLDLGCGVGVIGLSIAKAYPKVKVDLTDVNNRALGLANTNILANGLNNANAFHSSLYEEINELYDVIITNPPIRAGKEVVYKIVSEGLDHLKTNGKIILVIHKKHGSLSMQKHMNDVFGNCEIITKKNGFYVFESSKLN